MRQILENEFLRVSIEDHGAELVSVYDKENERRVMAGKTTLLEPPRACSLSKCRKASQRYIPSAGTGIPYQPAWICQRQGVCLYQQDRFGSYP